MKLVVGLGNPGPQYETTRHNAGFLAIDRLVERWRAIGPTAKNQAEVYSAAFGGEKITLVKPQTFMNLSGRSVAPFFTFYHCAPEDLVVIHDDIDLPPMALRFKTGGGAGGHNGLKSIDQCLGAASQGYHRVRIGVGRPAPGERLSPADYVLKQFTDDEVARLDGVLENAAEGVEMLLKGEIKKAMNRFHGDKEQ